MRNEAAIILLALQFLTRFPVPTDQIYSEERLNAAVRYYPAIGLLIGAVSAGLFWALNLVFPVFLALALTLTGGLLMTGAFHEDGLADTFDGIGGGHNRERALEIMKDSRLGTYGTAALAMALVLKLASLSALPPNWILAALIAGHAVSRLSCVLVIATSTYARSEGTAKPVAKGMSSISLVVAIGAGLVSLLAAAYFLPAFAILAAIVGLTAGHIVMRLLFERKLGGYTGDTLGAVQQSSEIGFYLGLAAWV